MKAQSITRAAPVFAGPGITACAYQETTWLNYPNRPRSAHAPMRPLQRGAFRPNVMRYPALVIGALVFLLVGGRTPTTVAARMANPPE